MGLDFSVEVAEIKRLIANNGKDIEIAAVLAVIYDRGIADERRRIKPIIQRIAANPRSIISAIERPLR